MRSRHHRSVPRRVNGIVVSISDERILAARGSGKTIPARMRVTYMPRRGRHADQGDGWLKSWRSRAAKP